MARRTRRVRRGKGSAAAYGETAVTPAGKNRVPLPSPDAGTNLVIADVVLRAAGGLLRDRMEKGLLSQTHGKSSAHRLVEKRGIVSSLALYGASRLARKSPLGLAVVVGGMAAKVFYDRGKRAEKTAPRIKPPKRNG